MDGESSPANIRHVDLAVKYKAEMASSFGEGAAPMQTAAEPPALLYSIVPAACSKTGLQKCREVKEGASQIQTHGCARGMPFLSNTSLVGDNLEMLVTRHSLWHRVGQHRVLSIIWKGLWALSVSFLSVAVGESVCLQMKKSKCKQKA